MRAKGIMEVAKLQNKDNGDGERSQDFAKQLFWGLKRKAPPVGHEYAAVREDDSSSDDDDEDDDEEELFIITKTMADRDGVLQAEVLVSDGTRIPADFYQTCSTGCAVANACSCTVGVSAWRDSHQRHQDAAPCANRTARTCNIQQRRIARDV